MGGNKVTSSTRIYNEGMIYQVDSTSSLEGSLIYCDKEYIGTISWGNAELVDEGAGEISFGNDIISSHFYVVLTKEELNKIEEDPDSSFVPFKEIYEQADRVHIDDEDYGIIISCLGAPFIREEELEYTREEISKYALKPALEIMFKWCPKTRPQVVKVTSNSQNVGMPSDAYGVVGLSLQQYGSTSSYINNPLIWAKTVAPFIYGGTGGYVYGSVGSSYADRTSEILNSVASSQGMINYRRRVHYEGPYEDRDGSVCGTKGKYITVYSNIPGSFNIWWGIHTLDFNDVEFAQRDNAIKLCQAKVKQLFGQLRRQTKTDIPGQVDYKYLIEEGNEEEKDVVACLKKLVKSSGVIRGSL